MSKKLTIERYKFIDKIKAFHNDNNEAEAFSKSGFQQEKMQTGAYF